MKELVEINGVYVPRFEVVRARRQDEVLREIRRGQKAGEYGAATAVYRYRGGPWAGQFCARVTRLAEPVPAPAWRGALLRVAAVVGGVAAIVGAAAWAVVVLLREVVGMVAATGGGALAVVLILAAAIFMRPVFGVGKCCEVIVRHFH